MPFADENAGCFITSFRPKSSVELYDHSYRQEPAFIFDRVRGENVVTMTSLCRGKAIKRIAEVGNEVILFTTKLPEGIWKLVAHLKVVEVLPSHEAYKEWASEHAAWGLPSNCTLYRTSKTEKQHWESAYLQRAIECGTVVICEILFDGRENHVDVTASELRWLTGEKNGLQCTMSGAIRLETKYSNRIKTMLSHLAAAQGRG